MLKFIDADKTTPSWVDRIPYPKPWIIFTAVLVLVAIFSSTKIALNSFLVQENTSHTTASIAKEEKQDTLIRTFIKQSVIITPSPSRHVMYLHANGQLGNLIWIFASLFGISKTTNHIPMLTHHFSQLLHLFPNLGVPIHQPEVDIYHIHETHCCSFNGDSIIKAIPRDQDVFLDGYFQSWKYFKGSEQGLRKRLTVNPIIARKCQEYLLSVRNTVMKRIYNNKIESNNKEKSRNILSTSQKDKHHSSISHENSDIVYIGLHIRQGDKASRAEQKHGYKTVSASYIQKAIEHFKKMYATAQFILVTDDMGWVRKNVPRTQTIHFPTHPRSSGYDLVLLSQCNHTIISTGTFSWWAGWLAGGQVVYYEPPFKPGTEPYSHYNKQDTFPPDWMAMSD